MSQRSLTGLMALMLSVAAAATMTASPALAQLLPPGFFDRVPPAPGGQAAVEADMLSYDGVADIITASGNVAMRYSGYDLTGDRLVYNQRTGEMRLTGRAVVRDPQGTVYIGDEIVVAGEMKRATIRAMTLVNEDGSIITADNADHQSELETILTEATYSPCGLCIDTKGRRIGWQVKAAEMTRFKERGVVEMEQPSLELLGIPVAWLPWLSLPDPSQPRRTGFRLPGLDYSGTRGVELTVPYFLAIDENAEVLLLPTLMSRQGFWMGAEWTQRVPGYGEFEVSGSGIYQLDPSAFSGVGNTDWRGAIRSTGKFTPVKTWTAGWSYTAFTDAAYLGDYDITDASSIVNEVYATHVSADHFADVRVQDFLQLGNVSESAQNQQATTLPNARYETITELGNDMGRLEVRSSLINVRREADQATSRGAVDYVFGLEGEKTHLSVEAAWQKQFIAPAGVLVTPYLGLRADAAMYQGDSSEASAPADGSLLSATPIAAIDVRWPLIAHAGLDSHLLEPIAQLVYRGSDETAVGITNDNAQSFVLDDTNLFSYNRFSGSDRQETGLRANIGGRYQASFANGGWIELMAGQSFHLAGVNGLGIADHAQTGAATGLGDAASYAVLGAKGALGPISGGAKLQVDTSDLSVARAALAVAFAQDGWTLGADYVYLPAEAALGVLTDKHEVIGRLGIPLDDYWRLTGSVGWDIANSTWLEARAGAVYDDGFLVYGLNTKATPTAFEAGVVFKLKGPAGEFAF
ncbi:LPS-assembly protein [Devosia enhydra]|uniref:LPS-assembly protein LptD n=1 Tax=Devosia enhydra TaxID=665118 RepID=A0A1K2HSQ7_9HYPH|nr:LPS assembly protein LptD [Devosia enhydra]SFZ80893.1 LPS-assembly protein [Devosia enhydra]